MKFFMMAILISSSFAYGQGSMAVSKEALSGQFDSYVKQKSNQIEGDVENEVMSVAKLQLNEATDFDLIKNVLLTLVKLEESDPSRTTTMMLAQSYGRNKKLFRKAFAAIKTKENKKSVDEIEKLMGDFAAFGNG